MNKTFCDICGNEITPNCLQVTFNFIDKKGFVVGITSDHEFLETIDICDECAKKLGVDDYFDSTQFRNTIVKGLKGQL